MVFYWCFSKYDWNLSNKGFNRKNFLPKSFNIKKGLTGVKPGDVLLRVNDEAVLGRHHQEVVEMFAQVGYLNFIKFSFFSG